VVIHISPLTGADGAVPGSSEKFAPPTALAAVVIFPVIEIVETFAVPLIVGFDMAGDGMVRLPGMVVERDRMPDPL
jgi:hypothetical protein